MGMVSVFLEFDCGSSRISDGSGPKPGPGPARSPGFLESPRSDIGRRAQARAWPEPVVKSPGAQRALGCVKCVKSLKFHDCC